MGGVVVAVAVAVVALGGGVFDEGRLTKKVRKLQMQNSGGTSWVLEAVSSLKEEN